MSKLNTVPTLRPWFAARVSYGMNGIIMRSDDLAAFSVYLRCQAAPAHDSGILGGVSEVRTGRAWVYAMGGRARGVTDCRPFVGCEPEPINQRCTLPLYHHVNLRHTRACRPPAASGVERRNHTVRLPPDLLWLEWFQGKNEAAQHVSGRFLAVYRYNLFDHIGTVSSFSVRPDRPKWPGCFENMYKA